MNTIKKNSKKGFTLVELVVVIAILAILAAIAIPVVSNTIESSQRSSAMSNAQTLELALKEAHAMLAANDSSVYNATNGTNVAAVYTQKSLNVPSQVVIGGTTYDLKLGADEKVYYVDSSNHPVDNASVTVSVTATDITSASTVGILSLF